MQVTLAQINAQNLGLDWIGFSLNSIHSLLCFCDDNKNREFNIHITNKLTNLQWNIGLEQAQLRIAIRKTCKTKMGPQRFSPSSFSPPKCQNVMHAILVITLAHEQHCKQLWSFCFSSFKLQYSLDWTQSAKKKKNYKPKYQLCYFAVCCSVVLTLCSWKSCFIFKKFYAIHSFMNLFGWLFLAKFPLLIF